MPYLSRRRTRHWFGSQAPFRPPLDDVVTKLAGGEWLFAKLTFLMKKMLWMNGAPQATRIDPHVSSKCENVLLDSKRKNECNFLLLDRMIYRFDHEWDTYWSLTTQVETHFAKVSFRKKDGNGPALFRRTSSKNRIHENLLSRQNRPSCPLAIHSLCYVVIK